MKKLHFTILILSLIGCTNSEKVVLDPDSWTEFNWESEHLGESHIYLHFSEDSLHFKLNWFMWQKAQGSKAFVQIAFEDDLEPNHKTNIIHIPPTISKSNLKIDDGFESTYPLDQNPSFKYNKFSNEITIFDKKIKANGIVKDSKVIELVKKQDSWSGENIKF